MHEHVAECADCQSDIDRLRGLLASADKRVDSEQRRRDSAITELLSLHFAWIDELVTCRQTKPLLPSLADSHLRIRIPTPITAHVDNCPACSKDLSALRDAALTHKQLCRLSRILAEDVAEDTDSRQVLAAFPLVAEMIERPDSGIATRFTFSEPGESSSAELCNDRPIDVEVIGSNENSSAHGRPTLILNLKRYAKPIIAAAAVILIGLVLFSTRTTVAETKLDQIYTAIKNVSNVHVTKYVPDRIEPEREIWVSSSQRKYMSKVGQDLTLWDVSASRKFENFPSAAPKAVPFTEAGMATARKRIDNPLGGLVPFGNISDVPPGATWNRVPDDAFQPGTQDSEVYDLTWTTGVDTRAAVVRKWRVFVDPATARPRMARYYDKPSGHDEDILQAEYRVAYPSNDEVRAAIEKAFP